MKKLMMCGHTANAVYSKTGEPCCAICIGIHAGAMIVSEDVPDLTGRKAVCSGCKHKPSSQTDSKFSLAFFSYHPEKETDEYYCGCWGWN